MVQWIVTDGKIYECPVCHATFNNTVYRVRDLDGCPCCGVPIKEEKREKLQDL